MDTVPDPKRAERGRGEPNSAIWLMIAPSTGRAREGRERSLTPLGGLPPSPET